MFSTPAPFCAIISLSSACGFPRLSCAGLRRTRTLDEQVPLQKELDQVRKDIRRARVNVSTIEDETDEKRHRLLDALQKKLVPEVAREELFTIRWRVV